MGYKNASRCSKNPWFLIQYFKFLNPLVFSKAMVISWSVNSFEVVAGPCIACYLQRAHCVCDTIIGRISRGTFPALAAIFFCLLWTTRCSWKYVCISQLPFVKICRTAEYRNASRSSKNLLVLIHQGAVRRLNWFVSLWCPEAFILPMAFVMYHMVEAFPKWILLMWKNKEWSQTSTELK